MHSDIELRSTAYLEENTHVSNKSARFLTLKVDIITTAHRKNYL